MKTFEEWLDESPKGIIGECYYSMSPYRLESYTVDDYKYTPVDVTVTDSAGRQLVFELSELPDEVGILDTQIRDLQNKLQVLESYIEWRKDNEAERSK